MGHSGLKSASSSISSIGAATAHQRAWARVWLLAAVPCALGCEPSAKLESAPAANQPATEQTHPAPVADPPARRVAADKPVNSKPGTGYLGAVAGGYRSARERIESLPVEQAIKFWHAEHGRYPKSHEEFMEKVWKPLQTPLPEIEEGYEYRYDPEDHIVYKVLVEQEVDKDE